MGRPRKNKRKLELHPDINEYYYEGDSTDEMDIYGFAPLDSILDPLLEAEKEAKKEARRIKRLEAKRQKLLLEAEQTEPVATDKISENSKAHTVSDPDTGDLDKSTGDFDKGTGDSFVSSERDKSPEPRSSESTLVDHQK
ncbi:hypothetical protein BD560DRAFT_438385 [Blakeslea trispora]|nr:hypothetical protein BD560DRAFT_438385 [Blakeslea trispora]